MPEQPPKPRRQIWEAIGFAWDFGLIVVVPLVGLAVGGRLLDRQFGTAPWLFLAGVLVAITISTILVIQKLAHLLGKISNPKR